MKKTVKYTLISLVSAMDDFDSFLAENRT